jgi:hypothetical protein
MEKLMGSIVRICVMVFMLVSSVMPVHAEDWVRYSSVKMQFPAGDNIVPGYSESSYDSGSLRYYDGTRFEIWLKHVTYIGDLEPHITRELIRIDCLHNTFESLVEGSGNPSVLSEINRGEIGVDSSYRVVRERFCGLPQSSVQ